MEPVVLRNVTLDDRHETGEPRFQRQQVVERGIQASRSVGVSETVANGEDAAPAVIQELEPHVTGERRQPAGERPQHLDAHVWGSAVRLSTADEHRLAPVTECRRQNLVAAVCSSSADALASCVASSWPDLAQMSSGPRLERS